MADAPKPGPYHSGVMGGHAESHAAASASQQPPSHALGAGSNASHLPSSSGAVAPPKIRRRNRMITSCLECRRRKLKCNKSHPCVNCSKSGRDCVFLAPALDSASQLRLTEIKEKMGSLERVLEQDIARRASRKSRATGPLAGEGEAEGEDLSEAEDERDLEPTSLAVGDAAYDDDADDDLMDLGIQLGKMRITERVGGFFRPKMAEELDATLKRLQGPDDKDNSLSRPDESPEMAQAMLRPGPSYIPPSSTFFFGGGYQPSLLDFLPPKESADRLIQQYWDAVHCIARIVHRPSFERQYETFWVEVSMGIEPANSLQALVFAAMFSGLVSMPYDLVFRNFGSEKSDLVDNFRAGTETALARANFLRSSKVETLQAFVMYLIPLCRDQISRAHSTLTGTAIRMAECMGLHRDGTNYGLSPVEVHVRRLIWYQLCFLDVRTCEAQGPRPSIRKDDYDTLMPLNIDDADLETQHPPRQDAKRWTDVTFTRMRFECMEMHRVVWIDRPRLERKETSLTAVLGKIENFRKSMNDKYLPLIDENVPIQHLARLLLDVLISRMHIMILHRYHDSVHVPCPDRLRQIILTTGTQQLEDSVTIETLPSLSPWTWYMGASQQYHTAFLLLVEVFTYPMRREADRIWKCLDYIYAVPAQLPRREKARRILTELRDKMGVYQELRKMRAPKGITDRLRQPPKQSPPYPDTQAPAAPLPSQPPVSDSTSTRAATAAAQEFQYDPAATYEAVAATASAASLPGVKPDPYAPQGIHYAPPPPPLSNMPPTIHDHHQQQAYSQQYLPPQQQQQQQHPHQQPPPPPPPASTAPPINVPLDDPMIDIDWAEWDKIFPPNINTGDINLPYT
ncbi:MAG: hypothetical protein M1819_002715 [Sarea resinae]|nr:MAG: hypothetical protein M1819_002715 [Sarea resinae]